MSWKPEVDEIEARRRSAREMGGPEAVARQHERGRLTVRERVAALVDADTLEEQAPIAGETERDENGEPVAFHPANYLLGLARLDGRPVVVGGEDFTQRGGSPSPAGLRRSVWSETLAIDLRLPLVRFLEGGGGSVAGPRGPKTASAPRPMGDPVFTPSRFLSIAQIMQVAPVASASTTRALDALGGERMVSSANPVVLARPT